MSGKKRESKTYLLITVIVGTTIALGTPCPAQSPFLTPEHKNILDYHFRVHMNYFLSPKVITKLGLPLCAYQPGRRAYYGHSGPADWGYALQAWIAAAERRTMSPYQARLQIQLALRTMQTLQINGAQTHFGLFYPAYTLTDWLGDDLDEPVHDRDVNIPSLENALLYASLVVTKGWGLQMGDGAIVSLASSVMQRMGFHHFLCTDQSGCFLARFLNTLTGQCSPQKWDTYADEGGMINWIAYLSDAITLQEFKSVAWCQSREARIWNACTGEKHLVREAAHANTMNTWAYRPLAGFPIGMFESQGQIPSYLCQDSFIPAIRAHLAYGDCLEIDYPAFSDAPTQTNQGIPLVQHFAPVNMKYDVPDTPPTHCMPHAFFIPFNAGPNLDLALRQHLITLISELTADQANYYHSQDLTPFGFEVCASPVKNTHYAGPDRGRLVFETRSHAYTVLSLFNCLQHDEAGSSFFTLASQVPNYLNKVATVLHYLYSPVLYSPNPVGPSITPVVGIYRFGSVQSPYPQTYTATIDHDHLKIGSNVIVLEKANDKFEEQWLIWDSLSLETDTGEPIWQLGLDESPPVFTHQAYDEFDNSLNFLSDYYVNQMNSLEFPRELNNNVLPKISIVFDLNAQEARRDLLLTLDTVFAVHEAAPYFEVKVSVNPAQ